MRLCTCQSEAQQWLSGIMHLLICKGIGATSMTVADVRAQGSDDRGGREVPSSPAAGCRSPGPNPAAPRGAAPC